MVNDLNGTKDGESGEESHGPSNQTKRCLSCHLHHHDDEDDIDDEDDDHDEDGVDDKGSDDSTFTSFSISSKVAVDR